MSPTLLVARVLRRGPLLPAPYRAAFKHKPTFFGKLAMERWLSFGRAVPFDLKVLAQLRASSLIGCLW